MAHQEITLNYIPGLKPTDEGDVKPERNPIVAGKGDTIVFKKGTGPADGKVRVTFKEPSRFSTGTFNDGDQPVTVQNMTSPTTYHCELLVNGKPVASSKENAGGDIVPPTGN